VPSAFSAGQYAGRPARPESLITRTAGERRTTPSTGLCHGLSRSWISPKASFEAHLLTNRRQAQRQAGQQRSRVRARGLATWGWSAIAATRRWRLHVCMEGRPATWGLDLARLLYAAGIKVSIVNPKAGQGVRRQRAVRATRPTSSMPPLIARFCRAPPAAGPGRRRRRRYANCARMVRRCAALKVNRTQEIKPPRRPAMVSPNGCSLDPAHARTTSSPRSARSPRRIRALIGPPCHLCSSTSTCCCRHPQHRRDHPRPCSWRACPTSPSSTPKGPSPPSTGPVTLRRTVPANARATPASAAWATPPCAVPSISVPSAPGRHNPRLADFRRPHGRGLGKPNKVILIAVAREAPRHGPCRHPHHRPPFQADANA